MTQNILIKNIMLTNQNFGVFRTKSIIIEFREVDAIQYIQMITKSIRYYISKITCLIKII